MDESDHRIKTKEEAAAWFLRFELDEISQLDREAFVEWLRESPLHVAEMLRVTNVHDRLAAFGRWAELDTRAGDKEGDVPVIGLSHFSSREPDRQVRPPFWHLRSWVYLAVAACLLAIGLTGVDVWSRLAGGTMHTDRGERRAVALSDGTTLQIAPDTDLRVRFDKHLREIRLDRGRVMFRVARDPTRPFLVRAERTVVRAVGTSFAVERADSGVRITVSEGKVAVAGANSTARSGSNADSQSKDGPLSTAVWTASREQLLLTANQQVIVPPAGPTGPIRPVDAGRELAWTQGQLVFEKQTVASVVSDFNRYNQIQLRVTDTALATRIVSGVLDVSDPESFIAFLSATGHVKVTRVDGKVIDLTSGN